jgi:hypothetical protein
MHAHLWVYCRGRVRWRRRCTLRAYPVIRVVVCVNVLGEDLSKDTELMRAEEDKCAHLWKNTGSADCHGIIGGIGLRRRVSRCNSIKHQVTTPALLACDCDVEGEFCKPGGCMVPASSPRFLFFHLRNAFMFSKIERIRPRGSSWAQRSKTIEVLVSKYVAIRVGALMTRWKCVDVRGEMQRYVELSSSHASFGRRRLPAAISDGS